jgi:membrane protein implicated in regulation of membrane protease activity
MTEPMLWWITAGLLVVSELLTGTFYLLMLALGATAGAMAAYAGVNQTWQIVIAALVGVAAITLWHLRRLRHTPPSDNDSMDPNQHFDIGETVQVTSWNAQGEARVQYRGTQWPAICADRIPHHGPHRIVEIKGSRLVLSKI